MPDPGFHIKICGVTRVEDAIAVRDAGGDAIGLNFYSNSSRYVPPDRAASIAQAVGTELRKIGVFVNASAETICRCVDAYGLYAVQLHGDEPAELLAELRGVSVIRAFRVRPTEMAAIDEYLAACAALGAIPHAVLFDAFDPKAYGGTGTAVDWTAAAEFARQPSRPPLILAGGLDPDNVAAAIVKVRPDAVDVASGVEHSPGRKDADKVRAFVEAARRAFSHAGE